MAAFSTQIFPDAESLANHAASWIVDLAVAAGDRKFALCLSGGSTPKRLYQILATTPLRTKMPWSRVNVFFGDERFVPRDDPESNFRMADQAMIAHVPIPPANVHPVPVDGTPQQAALAYAQTLRDFYGAAQLDPARPLFDVTLLGLGEDGHTASLFPGTAVLDEQTAWVAAVVGAKPEPRITLTYPVLASSKVAAFLIAGAGKTPMLQRLLAGDRALPSARVTPVGALYFLIDRAAAGLAPA
jgi:6-phosphogluconolactonase